MMDHQLPDTIAFKEWQVVCDALAGGDQCVILRKGGIHEGRDGFSFAHAAFYLFPTRFHAQISHVRSGSFEAAAEWRAGDSVQISHHAEVVAAVTITDAEVLAELEPFHILTSATVRERFDWQGKGMAAGSIHAALVRVRPLAETWDFPYEARFGGCRSWLTLPSPPEPSQALGSPVVAESQLAVAAKVLGVRVS